MNNAKSLIFILGRTADLALTELHRVYPDAVFTRIAPAGYMTDAAIDVSESIARLGGTVKIAADVTEVTALDAQSVASYISNLNPQPSLTFGVSPLDTHTPFQRSFLEDIKAELVAQGYSVRYVASRHEAQLSSVVVSKQQVCEVIVSKHGEGFLLARTVAVQDFEDWNRRDYGRPHADPKAGMLPPKVARMIANIALGDRPAGKTLLDPFCGMGTVLIESMLIGAGAVGSDISEEVAAKAEKNVAWAKTTYPRIVDTPSKVLVSDAVHISDALNASVDAIATEPYMGPTRLGGTDAKYTQQQIKNIVTGLEKLYIGALKDWKRVLKQGGIAVIALPSVQIGKRRITVKRVVDTCENVGYTTMLGPIEYSRPNAAVARQFYVFQLQHTVTT